MPSGEKECPFRQSLRLYPNIYERARMRRVFCAWTSDVWNRNTPRLFRKFPHTQDRFDEHKTELFDPSRHITNHPNSGSGARHIA